MFFFKLNVENNFQKKSFFVIFMEIQNLIVCIGLWLWCLTPLSTIFQLYLTWWSVLFMEETGVPRETHWPAESHCQTLSHNVEICTPHLSGVRTHNFKGDRNWLHRYYTITTTVASIVCIFILLSVMTYSKPCTFNLLSAF